MLIQPRDNDIANDTSTTGQTNDEPNLIATNTTPDKTLILVDVGALVVAIAAVVVAIVYRRKK